MRDDQPQCIWDRLGGDAVTGIGLHRFDDRSPHTDEEIVASARWYLTHQDELADLLRQRFAEHIEAACWVVPHLAAVTETAALRLLVKGFLAKVG